MNLKLLRLCTLFAMAYWLVGNAPIQAQPPDAADAADKAAGENPDPFGADPAAPQPADNQPVEPNAPKPAAKATTTNANPDDVAKKPETNPAVLSALELPRKKPADFVKSILWLIDLGRPELAKPILEELAKLQLTDAQRIELVDEFGASGMLKLASAKELAPAGAAFADACMASSSAAVNNTQRIAALVKQLSDFSAEKRFIAQNDLAASGQTGAIAVLEAYARETDPNRRLALARGIAATHPLVDAPLLAMLETRDPSLYTDVANLLRQLKVSQAAPFVSATANSMEPALAKAYDEYRKGMPIFTPDADNQVVLWQWNDASKQLSSVRLPANQARIVWMSKLARTLAALNPQNSDYQRRAAILAWESAALTAAAGQPASVEPAADTTETRQLNDILAESLKDNFPHAAIAAANALAKRGDVNVLFTFDGKPSPLAAALASPHRNVRFSALGAIITLDPSSPFPGSSFVPEALAWFAGGSTGRQALVAMPTRAAATDLAGLLTADGLAAETTNRGRDAVKIARDLPDLEAIFIDMDILKPGIREVLFELRTNPTTGQVPIAILAADGRLVAAEKLAAEHQRVIAVPRPHSPEVVANVLKEIAKVSATDLVPANVRAAQAAQARTWLAKLESGNRPFYVFRRTARLNVSPFSGNPPAQPPKQ